jgi:NAD(P)-dependent dehydrogenase (short-subunit alcohol dehydrogenase family)
VTQLVLTKGEIVVAAMRTTSALDALKAVHGDRLLVLKCDVTKPEDVRKVFHQTIETFGRCDVVLNNAGYLILAEIEGTPDEAAKQLFDVNFWGAVNVSKEAIRVFRESGKGGRLMNMSSINGLTPCPAGGFYTAR